MFLLSPLIFPWDMAILLLLAGSFAIGFAARRARARRCGWLVRFLSIIVELLTITIFVTVAYGSFVEPQIIVTTRYVVPLTTTHPIKIAIISDLHAGPYKGADFYRRVVRNVNALLPDIIVLDGDFILEDTVRSDTLLALEPLRDLRSAMGTFAVLGNHDHGVYEHVLIRSGGPHNDQSDYLAAALRSLGIQVLRNEHALINMGTERIAVVGIDDLWAGKANLAAALAGIDPSARVILLSHNPDVIRDPLSARANLIISGHTHGGQIRLPFFGPLASLPTRIGPQYDQGIFRITGSTTLAITHGVGESGPRARLFAWPEVLMLTTQSTNVEASGIE